MFTMLLLLRWNERHAGSQSRPRKPINRRDCPSGLGDELFVFQLEPFEGTRLSPVLHEALIVGEDLRQEFQSLLHGTVARLVRQHGDRDVLRRVSAAEDDAAGEKQSDQSQVLVVFGVLVDHPDGLSGGQAFQAVEVAFGLLVCADSF